MPQVLPDTHTPQASADMYTCRQSLRQGSRSFHAASLLLPQPFRDAAVSLYAFCREADDGIDNSAEPEQALAEFHRRLEAIYLGSPGDNPADRALAVVVARFGVPRALLDALLEGFAWDCSGRRYANLSELYDYAARVAGTVGVMMAVLMGERDPHVLARAADLGVAMQLTNIARDVGEDARAGRVYLPQDWLAEAGVELGPEPGHSAALALVIERLLSVARDLYRRSEAGMSQLPARCRPCILAARLLYAEIGEQLARTGYDAVTQRAIVSPTRKLFVLSSLARVVSLDSESLLAPPLTQVEFLIDAVGEVDFKRPVQDEEARGMEWVLDLFAELEQRDRAALERAPVRVRRQVPKRPVRQVNRRVIRGAPPVVAS